MRNAYIKFRTDQDCEQLWETLVADSTISRLSNGVFCVPWGSLAFLDARDVEYSFASEADLADVHPIWNVASTKPR